MPLSDYDQEVAGAWGAPPPAPASKATDAAAGASEPTVESTLAKERIIKDVIQLRDGLRELMVRTSEVEKETDKLKKDNEFLATYIDNL